MGMYTHWGIAAELTRETPDLVIEALRWLTDPDEPPRTLLEERQPQPRWVDDHPLWRCSRLTAVLLGGGSVSDAVTGPRLHRDGYDGARWQLCAVASLKNYDSEIEKFCEWLGPHLSTNYAERRWIGWKLHEEADDPTLIYVLADGKIAYESPGGSR